MLLSMIHAIVLLLLFVIDYALNCFCLSVLHYSYNLVIPQYSYLALSQFCMISSPNFEKPPVLISLLDPSDYWFDFGALEALEAAAEGCFTSGAAAWLFVLLWLACTPEAAALLLGATDCGFDAWLA